MHDEPRTVKPCVAFAMACARQLIAGAVAHHAANSRTLVEDWGESRRLIRVAIDFGCSPQRMYDLHKAALRRMRDANYMVDAFGRDISNMMTVDKLMPGPGSMFARGAQS